MERTILTSLSHCMGFTGPAIFIGMYETDISVSRVAVAIALQFSKSKKSVGIDPFMIAAASVQYARKSARKPLYSFLGDPAIATLTQILTTTVPAFINFTSR